MTHRQETETATLAGGCFWCTEAIFKRIKGVISVTPGYSGEPRAETLQIGFDPKITSFKKILEIFFATHDPTTINQQGYDIGPQYRSAIFYRSPEQKKTAEKLKKADYVTEIVPFKNFYPAEDYHREFYDKNRNYPYCQVIIDPKIKKLLAEFPTDLKSQSTS